VKVLVLFVLVAGAAILILYYARDRRSGRRWHGAAGGYGASGYHGDGGGLHGHDGGHHGHGGGHHGHDGGGHGGGGGGGGSW
jgi:hypothetical protein